MFNRTGPSVSALENAIEDATKELGPYVHWESWVQTWGDTSLGFGGLAGQAFTKAQTVVVKKDTDYVMNRGSKEVRVYHGGRYAYTVSKPNELFYTLCEKRQLPGASHKKVIANLEE